MSAYSLDQVNAFVAEKQHLTGKNDTCDIPKVARDICGLHSTGPTIPYISSFCRMNGNLKKEDFEREIYDNKSIAKLRSVRKTVYAYPLEMLPAAFVASREQAKVNFERYLKAYNLSESWYKKRSREILKVLNGKSLTTSEIRAELHTSDNISTVVNAMCDECILVRGRPKGSWKSNTHYYSIFKEYLPGIDMQGVPVDEARALMIKWYMAAFGPASEKDVAWWTGFRVAEVRKALEGLGSEVSRIEIEGHDKDMLILSTDGVLLDSIKKPESGNVMFLPYLDSYIMGYKERQRYLESKYYDYVFDRSGNGSYTVWWNNRIVGVWDVSGDGEQLVKVLFFKDVPKYVVKKAASFARNLGRFITDDDVEVLFCDSMVPLPRRTAGGFMTPLKLSGTRLI